MDQRMVNEDVAEFERVCIIIDAAKPVLEIIQVRVTDEGEIRKGYC